MSSMRDILREEFEPVLEARMDAEPQPKAEPEPKAEPKMNSEDEVNSDSEPEAETDELESAPEEVDSLVPYEAFRRDMSYAIDWASENHVTAFAYGIYTGLAFPQLSWAIFAATWTVPTLIVLRHSEWFPPVGKVAVRDLLAILGICAVTQSISMLCMSKIVLN